MPSAKAVGVARLRKQRSSASVERLTIRDSLLPLRGKVENVGAAAAAVDGSQRPDLGGGAQDSSRPRRGSIRRAERVSKLSPGYGSEVPCWTTSAYATACRATCGAPGGPSTARRPFSRRGSGGRRPSRRWRTTWASRSTSFARSGGRSCPARVIGLDDAGTDLLDRIADENAGRSQELAARRELIDRLAEDIAALPPRMQQVLSLYYRESLSLREIGLVLGVTECRVCQIHGEATKRLRRLEDGGSAGGGLMEASAGRRRDGGTASGLRASCSSTTSPRSRAASRASWARPATSSRRRSAGRRRSRSWRHRRSTSS